MSDKKVLIPWVLLIVLAIIWGGSFILIKKSLIVFSPQEVAVIRISSACLVLLPISLKHLKKLKRKQASLLFFSGLLGSFFPAFLFATAQTKINSSITGVLNSLVPMFALIIAVFFFKQRLTKTAALGLIIGFFGTILIVFANSSGGLFENINYYALLVVVATICYAINTNIIKYYLSEIKPEVIASVSLLMVGILAILFLFFATPFLHNINTQKHTLMALSAIITLGVLGTAFALILFNRLIQLTDPIFASSVTYLIPIVAVLLGVLDQEILLWQHIVGMITIIVGVYITNRGKNRSK